MGILRIMTSVFSQNRRRPVARRQPTVAERRNFLKSPLQIAAAVAVSSFLPSCATMTIMDRHRQTLFNELKSKTGELRKNIARLETEKPEATRLIKDAYRILDRYDYLNDEVVRYNHSNRELEYYLKDVHNMNRDIAKFFGNPTSPRFAQYNVKKNQ